MQNGVTTTALTPTTLDFYDEEISVIYGFSGSGKSTIVKTLTGMYKVIKSISTFTSHS